MSEYPADQVLSYLRPLASYLQKAGVVFQAASAEDGIPDLMTELVTDEQKLGVRAIMQSLAARVEAIDGRRQTVSTDAAT